MWNRSFKGHHNVSIVSDEGFGSTVLRNGICLGCQKDVERRACIELCLHDGFMTKLQVQGALSCLVLLCVLTMRVCGGVEGLNTIHFHTKPIPLQCGDQQLHTANSIVQKYHHGYKPQPYRNHRFSYHIPV